jgi:hypothetical protein
MDENLKYFIAGASFAVALMKVMAKILRSSDSKEKKK